MPSPFLSCKAEKSEFCMLVATWVLQFGDVASPIHHTTMCSTFISFHFLVFQSLKNMPRTWSIDNVASREYSRTNNQSRKRNFDEFVCFCFFLLFRLSSFRPYARVCLSSFNRPPKDKMMRNISLNGEDERKTWKWQAKGKRNNLIDGHFHVTKAKLCLPTLLTCHRERTFVVALISLLRFVFGCEWI